MSVLVEIPDFVKIVIMIKKDNQYRQSDGYCLSYYTGTEKYKFTNISHCSCDSSNIGSVMYDGWDTHTHTYEDVKKLAQTRGDPRVPDAPIYDDQLGQIYDYILTKNNEEELLKDACIYRYCSDDESDNVSDDGNDNQSDNDEIIYGKKRIIDVYDYLCKKGRNQDALNHLLSKNI